MAEGIVNKQNNNGYITAKFHANGVIHLNNSDPLVGANSAGEYISSLTLMSADWSVGNNAYWTIKRNNDTILNLTSGQHYFDLQSGKILDSSYDNYSIYISKTGSGPSTLILKLKKTTGLAPVTTPAMALLTAYSRTLTDEVASYEATYTGASHKTMTDQYGLRTFAPNNLLTYSSDFSNASWLVSNVSKTVNTITGNSGTVQKQVYQNYSFVIGSKYTVSFELENNGCQFVQLIVGGAVGSGYVNFDLTNGTESATTAIGEITAVGDGYYKCSMNFTAVTGAAQIYIALVDSLAAARSASSASTGTINIRKARLSRVTHETTPRTCDDVDTTSAAYYGPRFVYAPETLEASTTSITIGSGSSYTFTTAAAHSFAVGNVVQATDNADPDNWIRGYVTDTTSTTVTLASYTFPGTAYSRPVLTNGSGTISDWSVIRSDGYLAEPAATNSCPYSTDFSNGDWAIVNGGAGSGGAKTPNYALAPDGTMTACRFVGSSNGTLSSDYSLMQQGLTLSATTRIGGFWVKSNTGSNQTFYFRHDTFDNSNTGVATTEWKFFAQVTTGINPYITIGTRGTANGNASVDLLVWNAQSEVGSVSTSPIVTAASSVSRAADVASMTGADFSGWWNATEGTFVERFYVSSPVNKTGARIIAVTDLTRSYIPAYISGTGQQYAYLNDGTNPAITLGPNGNIPDGSIAATAFAYAANDYGSVLDGGTVDTDSSTASMTVLDRLYIGHGGGSNVLNGNIQEIFYFNTRESDAQLVTLTGG